MKAKPIGWKAEVEKGKYYLGDPCYVFNDTDWDTLLDSCNVFENPIGIVRGYEILAFGTKYGDGEYIDNYGTLYPVDAGLIGLVPFDLIKKNYSEEKLESFGNVVEFKWKVICTSIDGVLTFGRYKINTGD